MLYRLVCFAAVIIYVAAADSGAAACSLDLVWPPPDAIILIGTDSEMIPAYLKLAGDCSEFFPLGHFFRLQLGIVAYEPDEIRDAKMLQPIVAAPLAEDNTPVSFRMMRSRLLGDYKLSQGLSIWSSTFAYPRQNGDAWHFPDSVASQ